VAGYIVEQYCLMFDRGVVHTVVVGYIVDHYCFMFHRGVFHVVVVILSTFSVCGLKEKWFMLWLVLLSTITV
jgi:hypothetical protein